MVGFGTVCARLSLCRFSWWRLGWKDARPPRLLAWASHFRDRRGLPRSLLQVVGLASPRSVRRACCACGGFWCGCCLGCSAGRARFGSAADLVAACAPYCGGCWCAADFVRLWCCSAGRAAARCVYLWRLLFRMLGAPAEIVAALLGCLSLCRRRLWWLRSFSRRWKWCGCPDFVPLALSVRVLPRSPAAG